MQIINQRLPPILHPIFATKNRGGIFIRGPVRPVMVIGQTGAVDVKSAPHAKHTASQKS
jgi:hypothetical protein